MHEIKLLVYLNEFLHKVEEAKKTKTTAKWVMLLSLRVKAERTQIFK